MINQAPWFIIEQRVKMIYSIRLQQIWNGPRS